MASRQVYIPDEMLEVWDNIPNKSALVREALDRYHSINVPNKEIYFIGTFLDRVELLVLFLIINVPKKVSSIQIRNALEAKHLVAKKYNCWFLWSLEKIDESVKNDIQESEAKIINWEDLIHEST